MPTQGTREERTLAHPVITTPYVFKPYVPPRRRWRRWGAMGPRVIFIFTFVVLLSGLIEMALLSTRSKSVTVPADEEIDNSSVQEVDRMGSEAEMEWLTRELGLTQDQVGRIRPIVDEERNQIKTIFEEPSLSTEERIAQVNRLRNTTFSRIAPILNPNQLKKLQQIQKPKTTQDEPANPGTTSSVAQ
jgi:hypothetical protein